MHSCRGKRRSANSVAASLPRRSVAASQRQQRRSVTASPAPGSVAASQRRSATRPPERRSVAASQRHPPPGASQRNVGNPRFGPLCPCTALLFSPFVFPRCWFWLAVPVPSLLPSPRLCVWGPRANFIDVDQSSETARADSLHSSLSAITGTLMTYDDFRDRNASTAHFSTNNSRVRFQQVQSAMIAERLCQVDLESMSSQIVKKVPACPSGLCVCESCWVSRG